MALGRTTKVEHKQVAWAKLPGFTLSGNGANQLIARLALLLYLALKGLLVIALFSLALT